jgi:hypothetical protein
MGEGTEFSTSYSPVGSVDNIWLSVALAAPQGLQLFVLDVSNAFQKSIIFDPMEQVYITLPSFYLDCFTAKWPDFRLPSICSKDNNNKQMIILAAPDCYWQSQ